MTVDTLSTRPIVGRRGELAQLAELLHRAADGAGGCVLIVGEPGAGKSRLVQAAAHTASATGYQVRTGHATDREVERTLAVGLDALDLRLDALVGPAPAARFVLEAGATAAASFLLCDRLLEVVERMCADRPLLLVLEDLHWSDSTSLTWLHDVAARAAGLPLAVIATTRPTPPGSAIRRRLDGLDARRIALRPLGADDVAALAGEMLGGPPDPAIRTALEAARGNPLLVLAMLDGGGSPHAVSLARRVAELGETVLRTVQAAGVLGPEVDVVRLAALLGRDETEVLADAEAAASAGVLVPDTACYAFRHELYRDAVLATLSRPARALLHLRAARMLVRAGAPATEIAEHFAHGARPGDGEAVRWLHDAAAEIVAAAPAGALRLVDAALRIAGRAPVRELMLLRVRALAGTGRAVEADLLGRSLLHDLLPAPTEALLRRELAFTALMRGQAATCIAEMQRCAAIVETGTARARVHGELAFARFMTLDHTGAREAAATAVDGGARHGDLVAQIAGDTVLCFLDLFANRLPQALDRARHITARAELPHAAEAHVFQPWFVACLVHLEADRLEQVAATARRGRQVALSRGSGWAVPGYDAVSAFGALRAGSLDDAAAAAEATLSYLDGIDGLGVAVWCRAFLAQIDLHRGDVDRAEAHLAIAERWMTTERAQLGVEQVLLARAVAFERRGLPEQALAALRTAWEMLLAIGVLSPLPAIAAPLARLARTAGDTALVTGVADRMTEATRSSVTPTVRAVAESAIAWRDVDADRALAAATLARRSPRPALLATTLSDAAALLRERGRRTEADRVAAEAVRRWSDIGACADAELVAARSRVARPGRGRPTFGVEALTTTERRIAGLVAEGLANAEIATTLGISRRTVESHVGAAYRKLDVSSRVALARIALTHDLGRT